ncbi:hypothetical protein TNCV_3031711 [Trichonephila clavipes]|nr:hypothetical protein TNCV_3031711 [Trichonephila clavipes]
MEVINKLKTQSMTSVLHLQWIPSHMNLKCNDIAGKLAKNVTAIPQIKKDPLTCFESIDITRRQPPPVMKVLALL